MKDGGKTFDRVNLAFLVLLFALSFYFVLKNRLAEMHSPYLPQTALTKTEGSNLVTFPHISIQSTTPAPLGQTYYVSPTGNDANPGTLTAPWQTIQKAANTVNPGDTVYVRGGIYTPALGSDYVTQFSRSGTANARITFTAYPGETPIVEAITGGTSRRNWGFYATSSDYITIKGFEIRGAKRAGIRLSGADSTIVEDNKVHDIRDTASVNTVVAGIAVMNDFSRGNIIRRNEVYDTSRGIIIRNEGGVAIADAVVEKNYVHDTHWWNTAGTYDDKNADGIVCNTTIGMIVRQNVITRSGDDAIDCYNSDNATIEKNTVFNSGDVLSGSPVGSNGDGNGIKVSTGGGGGHIIRRNIAFNNERVGFDQDHVEAGAAGNTFYHNVSYGNGRNGFLLERTSATPNILRNNIAFANDQESGNYTDIRMANSISTVIFDSNFNLWSDGIMPNSTGGTEGSNSFGGNPFFINPPPVDVANFDPIALGINLDMNSPQFGIIPGFKLQNNSPAVDTGTNLDNHHLGTSADLGAYESF